MADDLALEPGPLTPADPAAVTVTFGGPMFSPIVAAAYGGIAGALGAIESSRNDIAATGSTTTIDATHEQLLGGAEGVLANSVTGIAAADPSDVLGVAGSAGGTIAASGGQYTTPAPPDAAVPDPGPPPGGQTPPPGSTPETSI